MSDPTVQEIVAEAMAHAQFPEDVACPECRALYAAEESPFPTEDDCDHGPRMWDEIAADDAGVPRWGEL